MTNEEAIEILDAAGEGRTQTEFFDALDMGIAALKNQAKYEKALELACDHQAYDLEGIEDETCGHCQYCCDGCCHHEDMVDNPEEERPCLERVVEYYKRRAGIDS